MRYKLPYFLTTIALMIVSFSMFTTGPLSSVSAQTACSQGGSGQEMELAVPNLTANTLNVYWVDYACVEQLTDTIPSGEVFYQITYDGHQWMFRDENGQEVAQFTAASSSPTVVIGVDTYNPEPVISNCSSANTNKDVQLTVINNTDKPLLLYWIAFDCKERLYGVVRGNNQWLQPTFGGHDWVVRFADGKVAKQITVSETDNTVIIDPLPGSNTASSQATPQPSVPGQPLIVFVRFDGDLTHIYTMNPDGSNVVQLTQTGTENLYPRFSPDGSQIVFLSIRDGSDFEDIYIMNTNGTNVRRLTNNDQHDFHPDFSPDGTQIVYGNTIALGGDTFNNDIVIMNADGTNPQLLTTGNARERFPRFSPDGQRIMFHSDADGDNEIYTMKVDGTDVVQLTVNDVSDVFATYSPDGSRIVFRSERDGNREIYVMNADGTNLQRLTNTDIEESFPSFTPDGKIIFMRLEQEDTPVLSIMDADGTNVQPLGEGSTPHWYAPLSGEAAGTDPAETTSGFIDVQYTATTVEELIQAIESANATPDTMETIQVFSDLQVTQAHNTDELGASAFPVITSPITIIGTNFVISRDVSAPPFRFFNVNADGDNRGELILQDITLKGGTSPAGGAILNNGIVAPDKFGLTVTRVNFIENTSTGNGGAIFNDGFGANGQATMRVEDSSFENNSAAVGGAIYNAAFDGGKAEATITGSQFTANTATAAANTIYNNGQGGGNATLSLENVIINGLSPVLDNGEILNDNSREGTATVTINNS